MSKFILYTNYSLQKVKQQEYNSCKEFLPKFVINFDACLYTHWMTIVEKKYQL